ncbi:hypothetical protein D3C72_836900 [compost metagenome]
MTALVVASASLAKAVMPTREPMAMFSSTALAAALVSVGVVTSNSSTSLMAMVKVCAWLEPSALVAVTSIFTLAPRASRSMAAATVTTPVAGSMANRPPGLPDRL